MQCIIVEAVNYMLLARVVEIYYISLGIAVSVFAVSNSTGNAGGTKETRILVTHC